MEPCSISILDDWKGVFFPLVFLPLLNLAYVCSYAISRISWLTSLNSLVIPITQLMLMNNKLRRAREAYERDGTFYFDDIATLDNPFLLDPLPTSSPICTSKYCHPFLP